MNHAEGLEIIADLKDAFPRQVIEDGTLKTYIDSLADLEAADVKAAVVRIIRTSRFFPTIAEIRELVAERTLSIPSAADAWHEVQEKANDYDDYDEARKWPTFSHPLIKQTVNDLGGLRALYYSQAPGVDRAHFLKLFNETRADLLARAVAGELPAPAPVKALPVGDPANESTLAELRDATAKALEA